MASLQNIQYTTSQLPEQLRSRGVNANEAIARAAAQELGIKNGVYSAEEVDRIASHLKVRMGDSAATANIPEPPRKAVKPVQEPEPAPNAAAATTISEEQQQAIKAQMDQLLNGMIQYGSGYIAQQTPTAMKAMFEIGLSQGLGALPPANFTTEESA